MNKPRLRIFYYDIRPSKIIHPTRPYYYSKEEASYYLKNYGKRKILIFKNEKKINKNKLF